MKKLFFCLLTLTISISAQKLYLNKEFNQALQKQTRSITGEPGKNYWQNTADYDIKASIDPKTRYVTCSEDIVYSNNSPDTLKRVVIKLPLNLFKPESPKNVEIPAFSLTKGMEISKFTYKGKEIALDSNKAVNHMSTVMIVTLSEPIPPKSKANFTFDWKFEIPAGQIPPRMGTYDSTSFFVAYWFPRLAVYDDIYGWDILPYDGEHEFYNNYCNIDVDITVPSGFGVWATGVLQNPNEVLSPAILKKYNESSKSEKSMFVISEEDLKTGNVYAKNNQNTFKYSAADVNDFAFGLSDHYVWERGTAKTGEGTTVINVAYNPINKGFKHVYDVGKKTIEDMSMVFPAVPYVYPQITVFNGGDGMEFPMIVNDGDLGEEVWNVYVTSHEIAHQWIPFMIGTNETKYAWMDEGWAYFAPYEIQYHFVPFHHRDRAMAGYAQVSGRDRDFPLMYPMHFIKFPEWQMMAYYKGAIAYDMLQDLVGKETFNKGIKEFFLRWMFKHSNPYDFFHTFNDVTGKDLSWFWNAWFVNRGMADLAVKDVKLSGGNADITIEKVGELPIPVYVTLTYKDSTKKEIYKSLAVWENSKELKISEKIDKDVISVEVGSVKVPDAVPANNKFTIK